MPSPSPTLVPPFQPGPNSASPPTPDLLGWATPDAAHVRSWTLDGAGDSTFAFDRYGYPAPSSGSDRLDTLVAQAVAYIEAITGRKLDGTLPAQWQPLAQDAVIMRTEQLILGRTGKRLTSAAASGLGLKSMRAGDYSETRFDPGDLRKGRMLNPWDALSELLWLLATPERRLELLADFSDTPAPVAASIPMGGGCDDGGVYGYWP